MVYTSQTYGLHIANLWFTIGSTPFPTTLSYVSGMVMEDFLAQSVGVDMRVYLGGAYALVPQHRLDGTQVGAAFKQSGGK